MKRLPPGRVMIDVAGLELAAHERRRLEEPACAGVILFARNYDNREQLRALCDQIKSVRDPELLIAVDQEGGRVQRFRKQFTELPAMRSIGALWEIDRERGVQLARDAAYVIASELASCGIDFSFAPVLDIDHGCSPAIGDRAFHSSADAVIELAGAFIGGLAECGMSAVGKHFPGHGAVDVDTHHDTAIDHRTLAQIERQDLRPFAILCKRALAGIMPAHVIYDRLDEHPAGFSSFWLQDVLRGRLGFEGVVFSDDLSMQAASIAGDAPARARAALAAGCDIALVCNAPDDAQAVLRAMAAEPEAADSERILALHRKPLASSRRTSVDNEAYQQALARLASAGGQLATSSGGHAQS